MQNKKQIIPKTLINTKPSIGYPISDLVLKEEVQPTEVYSILQKMRNHIFELENRNSDLNNQIHELEISRNHYCDLYNHAPVGYLTINENNIIIEANEKIAHMLGVEQKKLIKLPLTHFIVREDHDFFYHNKTNLLRSFEPSANEIGLRKADGEEFWARLEWFIYPNPKNDGKLIRITISDINERKISVEELRQMVEENYQRTEELEAIFQISSAIKYAKNQSEIMPILINQSIRVMGAQTGVLIILEGDSLLFYSAIGSNQKYSAKKKGQTWGKFWETVSYETPVFLNDASKIPSFIRNTPAFTQLFNGIKGFCLAPLKMDQIIFGLLILGFSNLNETTIYQDRLASAISDLAGSALYRMNTTDVLKKMVLVQASELESIHELSKLASEKIDLESVIQNALQIILNSINSQIGAVFLSNENTQHLDLFTKIGEIPLDIFENMDQQQISKNIFGWSNHTRNNDFSSRFLKFQDFSQNTFSEDIQSFAGLPIYARGRLLGVLLALSKGRDFTQQEFSLLSYYANHLGLMVNNFQLLKKEENQTKNNGRLQRIRELQVTLSLSLFDAFSSSNCALDVMENSDPLSIRSLIEHNRQSIKQCLAIMKLITYELQSPGFQKPGLIPALKHRLAYMETKMGVRFLLENNEIPKLDPLVEEGALLTINEMLDNALINTNADYFQIKILSSPNHLLVDMLDNGSYYPFLQNEKFGINNLFNMEERIRNLKGNFSVHSDPAAGTQANISLPVQTN